MPMRLNVGHANAVIAVMGLTAAVAMGLTMRHLAGLRAESSHGSAQREVQKVFGGRLVVPAQLSYQGDGDRRVVITIQPRLSRASRRLAMEVGQFVWRHMADAPEEVEVVAIRGEDGSRTRVVVERPYISARKPLPSPVAKGLQARLKTAAGSPQPDR